MRFREFLTEMGLRVSGDKIDVGYSSQKLGDTIELLMGKGKGKIPYTTSSKPFYGTTIYSAYQFSPSNKEAIEILKALKGKSSKISIEETALNQLLNRTAQYLWQTLKNKKIDLIITPQSSSDLADKFAQEFTIRIPNVIHLPSTIHKASIEAVKLKEEIPEAFRHKLERIIQNVIDGKSSYLEVKKIPGQQRKFIYDFLELDPKLIEKIEGKTILIVDDIFTSGTTLSETIRLINQYNPMGVIGATIFKASSKI